MPSNFFTGLWRKENIIWITFSRHLEGANGKADFTFVKWSEQRKY